MAAGRASHNAYLVGIKAIFGSTAAHDAHSTLQVLPGGDVLGHSLGAGSAVAQSDHGNAHIVEVNPTYATVEKTGITADILSLYDNLNQLGVVLQFVRSGRIAITKSRVEHLDEYLAERERERQNEL